MSDATAGPSPRDPKGLWVWARGFIIAFIVLQVVAGAGRVPVLLIGDYDFTSEQGMFAALSMTVFGFAALGAVAALIVCAIIGGRLLYRLANNLKLMNSPEMRASPAAAFYWYFIPFANLWMPMGVTAQIWRGTFDRPDAPPDSPKGLIGWWWATWLLGNIASTIEDRTAQHAGLYEEYTTDYEAASASLMWGIAAVVFSVIAALLFMRILGKLTKRQTALIQENVFGGPGH